MNQFRSFRKNKDVTKKKLNKVKSTTLKISLIMLNFIFATFAWFTYTMILDTTVDVNLSAWQVDFKEGESVLGTDMSFSVETFYPGMDDDDYVKSIDIVNLGDRAASITYQISSIKILGDEYEIRTPEEEAEESEAVAEEGTEAVAEEDSTYILYISETTDATTNLKTIKLLNDSSKFPFEIILTHSIQIDIESPYDENQNKGNFEIRFTWPYEITELPEELPEDLFEDLTEEEKANLTDEQKIEALNLRKTTLDTQWGYDIANFYKEQAELEEEQEQGIEITLQVIAKQII